MDQTQQRVLAYEPYPGEPAAVDSLEVEIVDKQRRRLINSTVVSVVLGVVLGLLPSDPVTIAFVAILGASAGYSLWALLFRLLPCARLLRHPVIRLTPGPGQLLTSGAKVSVALAGPEPRWVVVRLRRSQRTLLAGVRQMFFVGPDARGRVLVTLPGGITGRFGRIRRVPAPGSVEPAVQPRPLVAARQDPVVTAFLREVWLRCGWLVVVYELCAVGIWAAGQALLDAPITGSFTTVLAVCYAVIGLMAPLRVAVLSSAVKTKPWQELHATLYTAIEPGASGTAKAEGRVLLADGEARIQFRRTPFDVLVNVRATERLWVLGVPERGKKVVVGLPGYPVLGLAKLR